MKKNTILRRLRGKIEKAILAYAAFLSYLGEKDSLEYQTLVKMKRWTREKQWVQNQTMDEIARDLNIRRGQLSLYFCKHVGVSFIRWRRDIRIKEAKRLMLSDKDIPLTAIGEAVGISDRSSFRRQFKEVTGLNPSVWRSKHQAKILGK